MRPDTTAEGREMTRIDKAQRALGSHRVQVSDGFVADRIRANRDGSLFGLDIDHFVGMIETPRHRDWWWIGEQTGKWLESAILTSATLNDAVLESQARDILARLLQAQEADGYLGITAPDLRTPEHPVRGMEPYEQYFTLHALITAYDVWGDSAALDAAVRLVDYYRAFVGEGKQAFWPSPVRPPENREVILCPQYTWVPPGTPRASELFTHSELAGHTAHYGLEGTLLIDPVLRLYEATGAERFLDWAYWIVENIDTWSGWDSFSKLDRVADGTIGVHQLQPYVHSHTLHMNFLGFLRLYRITGDASLLRKVEGSWEDIAERQVYITGGVSAGEHYKPGYERPLTGHVVETCANMSWLQLNLALLEITGSPRYAEAIETLLVNHVFAAQTVDGDSNRYHTPPNGFKPDDYFHGPDCCTSSGHRQISHLPGLIYAEIEDGVVVNQFVPSRTALRVRGQEITLEQETRFPETETGSIRVSPHAPLEMTVRVRVPQWCERPQLQINGVPVPDAAPGGYVTITRRWAEGDCITWEFPMETRWRRHDHCDGVAPWALTRGPVVYALDTVWWDEAAMGVPAPADVAADIRVLPHTVPRPTAAGAGALGPFLMNPIVLSSGAIIQAPFSPFCNIGRWYRDDEPRPERGSRAFSYAVWLASADKGEAEANSIHRAADFDVLPGFQQPPPGFGVVPFYWWMGDPLTPERIAWQLDQLGNPGAISGLQVNYAHSMAGGRSWGLTYPSDPPLFSEAWWDLFRWFLEEGKRRGFAVSLSDYTLGIGQGWMLDELLQEHPELGAHRLRFVAGDEPQPEGARRLTPFSPAQGGLGDAAVFAEPVPYSLDPMHPRSGPEYARRFFGAFEARFPGETGRGLNFFFSDELNFGVQGPLWNDRFAAEFRRRKGYDIVPELAGLFTDVGPRTPKIRLDYNDVMVALSEEGFFRPVYEWHEQRGMTMGCDHGGRGLEVGEFGDYFRTQRWNQGPGCDQPSLGKDVVRTKVASSIAHLYERPRVWLEGFYGSGWGTTPAELADATFANFVMGHNLLSLHGLYYSTKGGWWEWAPPCNGFRMPYWRQMGGFLQCVRRLSYLLSQGRHRCDVAILYPVAAVETGMGGDEAVHAAFETGRAIYEHGIDFDFIDFQSLARAEVADGELRIAGEAYRVLIFPACRALRHVALRQAVAFRRAGGTVIAVGALPEATEQLGRDDPEVAALVAELFPEGPVTHGADATTAALPIRDYHGPGYAQHRRIGPRDVYVIYGAPQGSVCRFRAIGGVERWDAWSAEVNPLPIRSQTDGVTELVLPLTEHEIQIVVFHPDVAPVWERDIDPPAPCRTVELSGPWEFELEPTLDNRFGDFHWPPTDALIGAEVRQLECAEDGAESGAWRRVTCTFGPMFWQLGPLSAPVADEPALRPDSDWRPYEFSWRWGIENDPGEQGYHGLKGQVHDAFIAMGEPSFTSTGTTYANGDSGASFHYLWTMVHSNAEQTVTARVTGNAPARVWLNGEARSPEDTRCRLRAGGNTLLLRYDMPGRGAFVLEATEEDRIPEPRASPELAMLWHDRPGVLPFDLYGDRDVPVTKYRFVAPPGLRALRIDARGAVRIWVAEQELPIGDNGQVVLPEPARVPVPVVLRIEPERGYYGGGAFGSPIRLECGPGDLEPGDWSEVDGLRSYSGGAWYRKTVDLSGGNTILDLGNVAGAAEIRVNGQAGGERVTAPWSFDITDLVQPGANRIEVLVCNTLANHYTTVPTRYPGATMAGLLGPVTLIVGESREPERHSL